MFETVAFKIATFETTQVITKLSNKSRRNCVALIDITVGKSPEREIMLFIHSGILLSCKKI